MDERCRARTNGVASSGFTRGATIDGFACQPWRRWLGSRSTQGRYRLRRRCRSKRGCAGNTDRHAGRSVDTISVLVSRLKPVGTICHQTTRKLRPCGWQLRTRGPVARPQVATRRPALPGLLPRRRASLPRPHWPRVHQLSCSPPRPLPAPCHLPRPLRHRGLPRAFMRRRKPIAKFRAPLATSRTWRLERRVGCPPGARR